MPDKDAHNKPNVSAELIRQYLAGELNDKAMHDLERQALDDPFLADALEGYTLHNPDQQVHQDELMARLADRVAPRKTVVRPMYTRWAAAAAILLLLFTGGWFLFHEQHRKVTEVSIAQADITKQETPVAPSAVPAPAAAPAVGITEKAADKKEGYVRQRTAPATIQAEIAAPAADVTARDDKQVTKAAEEKTLKREPVLMLKKAAPAEGALLAASPAMAPPPAAEAAKSDGHMFDKASREDSQRMSNAYAGNYAVSEAVQGKTPGVAVMSKRGARIQMPYDTLPAPVIGRIAYQQYLQNHTINPENKFDGVVTLTFTVMPDSTLHEITVVKSLNAACDAEAIRVVKEGPAWKPASDGKPARVTLEVIFKVKAD
ncbi:energy transducer TonB [Chitinophaga sp. HK235]|uniref:energy transducer TonB n=1 Tax=Chitinophaga sp. HK235 TaxID=2952571 RepID=UPI001BA7148C|nr:energy transducer TonB [Chitinophaga sp. HK235]